MAHTTVYVGSFHFEIVLLVRARVIAIQLKSCEFRRHDETVCLVSCAQLDPSFEQSRCLIFINKSLCLYGCEAL